MRRWFSTFFKLEKNPLLHFMLFFMGQIYWLRLSFIRRVKVYELGGGDEATFSHVLNVINHLQRKLEIFIVVLPCKLTAFITGREQRRLLPKSPEARLSNDIRLQRPPWATPSRETKSTQAKTKRTKAVVHSIEVCYFSSHFAPLQFPNTLWATLFL